MVVSSNAMISIPAGMMYFSISLERSIVCGRTFVFLDQISKVLRLCDGLTIFSQKLLKAVKFNEQLFEVQYYEYFEDCFSTLLFDIGFDLPYPCRKFDEDRVPLMLLEIKTQLRIFLQEQNWYQFRTLLYCSSCQGHNYTTASNVSYSTLSKPCFDDQMHIFDRYMQSKD